MPADDNDPDVTSILRSFQLLTRPPRRPRLLPPALQPARTPLEYIPPERQSPRMGPRVGGDGRGHIPAYLMEGGQMFNDGLYRVGDLDFNTLATSWERQWSKLCPGGGQFSPVVMQTPLLADLGLGTVAGHRGLVAGRRLAGIGRPRADRGNGGLIVGDGLVFVADFPHNGRPAGVSQYGSDEYVYEVLTTVDGQVLAVIGSKDLHALQDANWVIDLVIAPFLAPAMIRLAQGAARMCSVLVSRARGAFSRTVLAGPTAELAERGAAVVAQEEAAKAAAVAAAQRSYNPVAGITRTHHTAFVQAAEETQLVIVVRHTNPKSISLIERGCPGKPKNLEFVNTSPTTGIVTADTPAKALDALRLDYLVVGEKGAAQRLVTKGGKGVLEDVPLREGFWPLEKGQIIDPVLHKPVVGDYDLMGVIDPVAPGRNIGLVTRNYGELVTDVTNPVVQRAGAAVNRRMETDRVLHGAQDAYKGFRKGASAFEPGGTVRHFPTEGEVKAYYESLGRQTRVGQYPRPGPDVHVVDELAKRRLPKPTGWR